MRAALAGLDERAGAKAAGGGVVCEAHVEALNTGANDTQDRGSEANGDRGGGPKSGMMVSGMRGRVGAWR